MKHFPVFRAQRLAKLGSQKLEIYKYNTMTKTWGKTKTKTDKDKKV